MADSIEDRLVSDLQRDFGLTREQATGVVGNLSYETDGFRSMQEYEPAISGSRGGFGFAQWTGPRREEFERWSRDEELPVDSYEANYGFLSHELRTSEKDALEAVKKTKTVQESVKVFESEFLRAGIKNISGRVKHAVKIAGNILSGAIDTVRPETPTLDIAETPKMFTAGASGIPRGRPQPMGSNINIVPSRPQIDIAPTPQIGAGSINFNAGIQDPVTSLASPIGSALRNMQASPHHFQTEPNVAPSFDMPSVMDFNESRVQSLAPTPRSRPQFDVATPRSRPQFDQMSTTTAAPGPPTSHIDVTSPITGAPIDTMAISSPPTITGDMLPFDPIAALAAPVEKKLPRALKSILNVAKLARLATPMGLAVAAGKHMINRSRGSGLDTLSKKEKDRIRDREPRGRGDWGSGQGGSGLGGSGDFGFDPSDRSGNESRYD